MESVQGTSPKEQGKGAVSEAPVKGSSAIRADGGSSSEKDIASSKLSSLSASPVSKPRKLKIPFGWSALKNYFKGKSVGRMIVWFCAVVLIFSLGCVFYEYLTEPWSEPQDIRVTNVTSRSATISWVTDEATKGFVIFSTEKDFNWGIFAKFGKEVSVDDRDLNRAVLEAAEKERENLSEVEGANVDYEAVAEDVVLRQVNEYYVHHVTLGGLDPEETYYFMVGNGYRFSGEVGSDETFTVASDNSFTTYQELDEIKVPDPTYGIVVSGGQSVDDGVMFMKIKGLPSSPMSAVLNENGSWYIDLSNMRSIDGQQFGGYVEGRDYEELYVEGGIYGRSEVIENPMSIDAPADPIVLDGVFEADSKVPQEGLLVSSVYAAYQEEPCLSNKGTCMDQTKCENGGGNWNSGECPTQPTNIRCCYGYTEPEPEDPEEPEGSESPSDICSTPGLSDQQYIDAHCTCYGGGGTCIGGGGSDGDTCSYGGKSGVIRIGLCPGSANVRCCYTDAPPQEGGQPGGCGSVRCGPDKAVCWDSGPSGSREGSGGTNDCHWARCNEDGTWSTSSDCCGAGCGEGGGTVEEPLPCPGSLSTSKASCEDEVGCERTCVTVGSLPVTILGGRYDHCYFCPSGTSYQVCGEDEFDNGQCLDEYGDAGCSESEECSFVRTAGTKFCYACEETDCQYSTRDCGGNLGKETCKHCLRTSLNDPCYICSTELCSEFTYGSFNYTEDSLCDGTCKPENCIESKGVSGCYYCYPGSACGEGEFYSSECKKDGEFQCGTGTCVESDTEGCYRCKYTVSLPIVVEGNTGVTTDSCGGYGMWESCGCEGFPGLMDGEGKVTQYCRQGYWMRALYGDDPCDAPEGKKCYCPDTGGLVVSGRKCSDPEEVQGYPPVSEFRQCCEEHCSCPTVSDPIREYQWCPYSRGCGVGSECLFWDSFGKNQPCNLIGNVCRNTFFGCKCQGPVKADECPDALAPLLNDTELNAQKNDVEDSRTLVSGVHSQDDNSSTIILSPDQGLYAIGASGRYCTIIENEEYCFHVNSEGMVRLYIDQNANGYLDEGDIDLGVDGVILELSEEERYSRIKISSGYNSISFSLIDVDIGTMASEMLTYLNGHYEDSPFLSLSSFENGAWVVVQYREGQIYGSNDFKIMPGRGYILKSMFDLEVTLKGRGLEDPVPVSLKEGWNLMAVHGTGTSYTASSLIDSINLVQDLRADNVTKWSPERSRYEGLQKEEDNDGVMQTYGFDYPIDGKLGYFVRIAEGRGTWTPE